MNGFQDLCTFTVRLKYLHRHSCIILHCNCIYYHDISLCHLNLVQDVLQVIQHFYLTRQQVLQLVVSTHTAYSLHESSYINVTLLHAHNTCLLPLIVLKVAFGLSL